MATIEQINFNFSEIPTNKTFEIGEERYNFALRYNTRADFVVCELSKNDVIVLITKVLYWNQINTTYIDENLKGFMIVPLDLQDIETGMYRHTKITQDNFNTDKIGMYLWQI